MQEKTLSFEQLPELIQNLVERVESLEKTVREKQQPQPLEGELMSVEDLCKLLGKSKSAVYRTVRYRDTRISDKAIGFISTDRLSKSGSIRSTIWMQSLVWSRLRR